MSYQKLAPRSVGLRLLPRILHTRSVASAVFVAALSMFFSQASAQPNIPALNWTERSDWINVKTDLATNAVGNGIVDDTAALQEALDNFTENADDPKVVYLPPGTYRIRKTLEWRYSVGCNLIGHGRDTIIIWDPLPGSSDTRMLWSNGAAYSRFDGITWDADGYDVIAVNHNSTRPPIRPGETELTRRSAKLEASVSHYNSAFLNASVGIQGNYVDKDKDAATSEMFIENCLFENCVIGIDMSKDFNFYNQVILRCEFRDNDYGVTFGAGYGYVRFCHFEDTEYFDIEGADRTTVRYCTSLNSGSFYNSDTGEGATPGVIQNCVVSGWGGIPNVDPEDDYAVRVTENSLVFDNVFENPPYLGTPPVYFYQDEAIVSENVSAGTDDLYDFFFQWEYYVTEVPAGNRTRLPLNATDSFLITEREVPTKVFNATHPPFNAIPNDTLDDTAAVQATIDAAKDWGEGAIAYFPAGRYSLASTVNITGADYVVGGDGYHSDFEWIGSVGTEAEHNVMFAIDAPMNIHVEHLGFHEHLLKDYCTAIRHTENSDPHKSLSTYTGLFMPQETDTTNDLARMKEGLHISVDWRSTAYLGRVNGRVRIEDSANGIIVGEFLNGNHTLVDGVDYTHFSYPSYGFTGWGSMNGHDLVVDDNLSLVVGDMNFEQSGPSGVDGIRSITLLKGAETNVTGRRQVTVGSIKANLFDGALYFEIDDYEGQFSYLHGTPYPELNPLYPESLYPEGDPFHNKTRELVELMHDGDSPIDLFIGATKGTLTSMPILVNASSGLTLTTLGNSHERELPNEWYAADASGALWVPSTVAMDPNGPDFALEFDGVDDFLLGSTEPQFGWSNDELTAMAWVKPSALGQDADLMGYLRVINSGSDFAWYLRLKNDNTLQFVVQDSAGNDYESIPSQTLASINTWMHVAGVWDGDTVKLYINGVEELNGQSSTPADFDFLHEHFDHRLVVGGSHGAFSLDQFYAGALDEVRVYDEALSAATISTHYNGGAGSFGAAGEDGLVAGWHFNEGGNINSFDYNDDKGGLHLLHYEIDSDHNPSDALEIAANALDHFRELGEHLEDFSVGLPVSPIGLTATAVADNQINLSWTHDSQNVDIFVVELLDNDYDWVGHLHSRPAHMTVWWDWAGWGWAPSNVTTFACPNLQPDQEYSFTVRAYNSAGVSFTSNTATATTFTPQPPSILTWDLPMWSHGDWDHLTSNWDPSSGGPGPVAFKDGDEVHFDQNEIEVTLVGVVRPSKIVSTGYGDNKYLFTGDGAIHDAPSGPTSIEIANGHRMINTLANPSNGQHGFSGGVLIHSGGKLTLDSSGPLFIFGTGPITLDDGALDIANYLQHATLMNHLIIESGGGHLNCETNGFFTYAAPIHLYGDLTLGIEEWDRVTISSLVYLNDNVTITGGNTNTNSMFDTRIQCFDVIGPSYVLTLNVTGLGMVIESYSWDIAGLTKTGPGILKIGSWTQDVFGDTLRIEAGIVQLESNHTVSDLYLGGMQKTVLGTYGSTSSGATFQDDTYFSGTGVVTLQ